MQVEKGLPTAEEAYNFFTFNFEPDHPNESERLVRKIQKQRETTEEDRGEAEVEGDAKGGEDNQDDNVIQVI